MTKTDDLKLETSLRMTPVGLLKKWTLYFFHAKATKDNIYLSKIMGDMIRVHSLKVLCWRLKEKDVGVRLLLHSIRPSMRQNSEKSTPR